MEKVPDLQEQEIISSRRVIPRKGIQHLVKEYSTLKPWRSTWAIVRQWLVITGCFVFALQAHHWAAYLIAALIIGTRQHALATLMHEAAHYRLYKNRTLNELVSDFFCTLPLGLTTIGYRSIHFLHHKYTNTDKDPDWQIFQRDPLWRWPKTSREACSVFLGDLLGLNVKKNIQFTGRFSTFRNLGNSNQYTPVTKGEKFRLAIFTVFLIGLLYLTNFWVPFLLLWLVPILTVTQTIQRLRNSAEHLGLPAGNELTDTRHVEGNWFEKLIIAPLNINYHIAHHICPSVPYYSLPKLHKKLFEREDYRKEGHFLPNYLSHRRGVLSELITGAVTKVEVAK